MNFVHKKYNVAYIDDKGVAGISCYYHTAPEKGHREFVNALIKQFIDNNMRIGSIVSQYIHEIDIKLVHDLKTEFIDKNVLDVLNLDKEDE